MSTWVYFASGAQADRDRTLWFALESHVIFRKARRQDGTLNVNVQHLRPGDRILLVYREANEPVHTAQVIARIADVLAPVNGTQVIQRIGGPAAIDFGDAGYILVDDGGQQFAEVIPLVDVQPCELRLLGEYIPPNNAIHRLDRRDVKYVDQFVSPNDRQEPSASVLTRSSASSNQHVPADAAISLLAGRRPLFDAYLMVDWSSRRQPVYGPDSIWLAWGVWQAQELHEATQNVPTRSQALQRIIELLRQWQNNRVLVGFDFAFGYPSGFAHALELAGQQAPWELIWTHFLNNIFDQANNVHNRDAFAAQCNLAIDQGPGPFWGCPANSRVGNVLHPHRVGDFEFPYAELQEWRGTERRARENGVAPQSVWKINQGVSVGGQTIMGIPYVARLRFASDVQDRVRVWPFDTGWGVTNDNDAGGSNTVILAEIFPSLVDNPDLADVTCPDERQVRSCVRHAATLDADGNLEAEFGQPEGLGEVQLDEVQMEEGWILFLPNP